MEDSSPQPRGAPPGRSGFSANWRSKDDTPRSDSQPQTGNQRSFNQNRGGAGDAQSGGDASQTRLYIGNLLYTAQREDVEAFFTNSGYPISGISMSMDPMTGRNKSYAFADFETAEDAQRAMTDLNGQELLGRAVRINPGMRKEAGGGGGGGFQSRGQGFEQRRGGGDRSGGRMNVQDYAANNGYGQGAGGYSRDQGSSRPENPTRLYVGNLPNIEPELLESEMQALLSGFQIKTVSRLIAPHESKVDEPGNHYYCFVDFETPEEAEQVVDAYAGKESPWGGQLRINKARDNRQKRQFGAGGGGGGSYSGGGGGGSYSGGGGGGQYGGQREGPYSRPSGEARNFGGGAWR